MKNLLFILFFCILTQSVQASTGSAVDDATVSRAWGKASDSRKKQLVDEYLFRTSGIRTSETLDLIAPDTTTVQPSTTACQLFPEDGSSPSRSPAASSPMPASMSPSPSKTGVFSITDRITLVSDDLCIINRLLGIKASQRNRSLHAQVSGIKEALLEKDTTDNPALATALQNLTDILGLSEKISALEPKAISVLEQVNTLSAAYLDDVHDAQQRMGLIAASERRHNRRVNGAMFISGVVLGGTVVALVLNHFMPETVAHQFSDGSMVVHTPGQLETWCQPLIQAALEAPVHTLAVVVNGGNAIKNALEACELSRFRTARSLNITREKYRQLQDNTKPTNAGNSGTVVRYTDDASLWKAVKYYTHSAGSTVSSWFTRLRTLLTGW